MVAIAAERGEVVEAIEAPSSARRVSSMVNFQTVCRVTQPAATAVACEGLLPQPAPSRRCDVLLIGHIPVVPAWPVWLRELPGQPARSCIA